jgi:hypothetical protein
VRICATCNKALDLYMGAQGVTYTRAAQDSDDHKALPVIPLLACRRRR